MRQNETETANVVILPAVQGTDRVVLHPVHARMVERQLRLADSYSRMTALPQATLTDKVASRKDDKGACSATRRSKVKWQNRLVGFRTDAIDGIWDHKIAYFSAIKQLTREHKKSIAEDETSATMRRCSERHRTRDLSDAAEELAQQAYILWHSTDKNGVPYQEKFTRIPEDVTLPPGKLAPFAIGACIAEQVRLDRARARARKTSTIGNLELRESKGSAKDIILDIPQTHSQSERMVEVARLLSGGMRKDDIADRLGADRKTVYRAICALRVFLSPDITPTHETTIAHYPARPLVPTVGAPAAIAIVNIAPLSVGAQYIAPPSAEYFSSTEYCLSTMEGQYDGLGI